MSFDDGFVLGFSLGRKNQGGGDDNSTIVGVYVCENAVNVVTRATVNELPEDTEHIYYLDKKQFKKEITTTATSPDGTKTTSTKTISKEIIENIYNSELELLYRCELDADGSMLAVYDGEDNEILLEEPAEVVE